MIQIVSFVASPLIHRPRPTGIGGGVGFFIRESYKYRKVDTPNYGSFENIVILWGM